MRCDTPRVAGAIRRSAASLLAACLVVAASGACGPGGPVQASVRDAEISEAPWEAAFDASEYTEMVAGRVFRPAETVKVSAAPTATPSPDLRVAPYPGAKIEVFTARPDGRGPLVPVVTGTADADGRFVLGPVPPLVNGFRAQMDGMLGALISRGLRVGGAVNLAPSEERRCGLRATREIRGRVLGRDGRPAAGAHLTVEDLGFFADLTTAPDGSFSVRGPEDPVVVTLSDPAWDVVRATVPADTGLVTAAPIELRSTATDPLAGTVLTAADSRPVEGATVLWMDDPSIRTRSGPDGRYRLPVPRMGRIAAFGAGLAWKSYEVLRAGEHEIRLRPAVGVRGRVVDADGRPVASARIMGVSTAREGGRERVLGPLTAADGTFDFSWMPSTPRGAEHASFVMAWHRRLGASAAAAVPVWGADADRAAPPPAVQLKLWGNRDIECVVRDHAGAVVPGARIAAEWTGDHLDPDDPGGFSVLGVPLRFDAKTDATGSARMVGAPRDRPVTVIVSLWGLDVRREVPAGPASVKIDVPIPAGKSLAGHVVDRNGSPVAGGGHVTARLLDTPGVELLRSVPIGADGRFQFDELPDGEYALVAEAEGFDLRGGGGSRAGRDDAVLRVEKSFRLSVRIRFDGAPDDAALLPVTIAAEDRDEPSLPPKRLTLPAGPDGRVVPVGTYHPGTWIVNADAGDWRGRAEVVHPEDGGDATVDVRLERTLRFRALVEDDDGSPLSGVPIVVTPIAQGSTVTTAGGASQRVSGWTGDGGVVDLAGLRPGLWEARLMPKDRVPLVQRIQVPMEGKLTLRLAPHGELEVRVRSADKQGAPGAIVSLIDGAGADVYAWGPDGSQLSSRFRTGADGVVRMRGVPVGRIRCEVALGATRLPSQTVAVEPRKTAVLSFGE
ncbi:MAG: carboxypeptidase-like regulatory domain-containing protein [Planctomycetes bacterium]|nr:carboxypeptidase-like regulatory domain-containing protein [Planctomycetota bacterium]